MVWFFPIAFSACTINSFWCTIAFWATESAGKTGTIVLLFISCIFYTIRVESKRKKIKNFFASFIVLGVLLSSIAYLNEHVTKELVGIPRPSHLFIIKNTLPKIRIDSIYKINESERKTLLQELIKSDSMAYQYIDIRVQDHWVEEAGYSFPSGHSFNAFLLSTILGFSLSHSRIKWVRSLFFVPFAWAILVAVSRVAIGAHSSLDVSFGASLGLIIGQIFLYFDYTRGFITNR